MQKDNKSHIAIVLRSSINNYNDYIEHSRNLIKKGYTVSIFSSLIDKELIKGALIEEIQVDDGIKGSLSFYYKAAIKISSIKAKHIICSNGRGVILLALILRALRLLKKWRGTLYYDLRSGSVSGTLDNIKNYAHFIESITFDKKIVISKLVEKHVLGTNNKKHLELGVGVSIRKVFSKNQQVEIKEKLNISSENIVMIYSGSLDTRGLDTFYSLITNIPKNVIIIMVCFGSDDSIKTIKQIIEKRDLSYKVRWVGKVAYDILPLYYTISHIGICNIPEETRYNFQPPTKLYEYFEYGLGVITTKTKAIVDLQQDNPLWATEFYNLNEPINISALLENIKNKKIRSKNLLPNINYWNSLTDKLEDFLLKND